MSLLRGLLIVASLVTAPLSFAAQPHISGFRVSLQQEPGWRSCSIVKDREEFSVGWYKEGSRKPAGEETTYYAAAKAWRSGFNPNAKKRSLDGYRLRKRAAEQESTLPRRSLAIRTITLGRSIQRPKYILGKRGRSPKRIVNRAPSSQPRTKKLEAANSKKCRHGLQCNLPPWRGIHLRASFRIQFQYFHKATLTFLRPTIAYNQSS
jgi:hypothetical protein